MNLVPVYLAVALIVMLGARRLLAWPLFRTPRQRWVFALIFGLSASALITLAYAAVQDRLPWYGQFSLVLGLLGLLGAWMALCYHQDRQHARLVRGEYEALRADWERWARLFGPTTEESIRYSSFRGIVELGPTRSP